MYTAATRLLLSWKVMWS